MKICRYCKKEFKPNNKKNICCSRVCGSKTAANWPTPEEIGDKVFCPKCKRILYKDSFYKVKGKHKYRLMKWCIDCNKRHVNTALRKYKIDIVKYMGGKCKFCGYNKCIHSLDIHHINPEHKDPNFKQMRKILRNDLKKELEKCVLICANCHREIHTKNTLIED